MSSVNIECSDVQRMFFVSRNNSVVKRVRISRDMDLWVKDFCKKNNISFNYLMRLLLLNLYAGNIRVNVNKPIIVTKSNIVVNNACKLNKYMLRAEKILTLGNKNYERFLKLEKMDKNKMDYYTRKEYIKKIANQLIEDIENIIENIVDIEMIEKLKEQHRLQLKIYQQLIK